MKYGYICYDATILRFIFMYSRSVICAFTPVPRSSFGVIKDRWMHEPRTKCSDTQICASSASVAENMLFPLEPGEGAAHSCVEYVGRFVGWQQWPGPRIELFPKDAARPSSQSRKHGIVTGVLRKRSKKKQHSYNFLLNEFISANIILYNYDNYLSNNLIFFISLHFTR